jgi:short-subunit dehydrogenase
MPGDDCKVVVITGAASGIGRALAERFGRAGCRLGLLDRDQEGLDHLARYLSDRGAVVLSEPCDVTRGADCQRAIGAVLSAYGRLDVLINNAGITHVSYFADTDVTVLRQVMEVNFFGALHCTKAALPALVAARGVIVAISSVAGFAPLAGRSGYAASKHALQGFFGSLRAELRASGVRVMLVCPGFTNTAIGAHALGGDGGPARQQRTTAGRQADPADVAEAVYRGVRHGRRLLVLSPVGKLAFLISRLSSNAYERLMARALRAEDHASAT